MNLEELLPSVKLSSYKYDSEYTFMSNLKKDCESNVLDKNTLHFDDYYYINAIDIPKLDNVLKDFNKHQKQDTRFIYYKQLNNKTVLYLDIYTDNSTKDKTLFEIDIFGIDILVNEVIQLLKDNDIELISKHEFKLEEKSINWALSYNPNEGINYNKLPLIVNHTIKDIYYPAITNQFNTTLDNFIDAYIESEESVLILTGMKGSGKTELIRHISNRIGKRITLTFNEQVMMTSEFYADFMASSYSDILVMEDADKFLINRTDDNPIMQLFLNLSDGLITNNKKKFIFTTNLPHTNDIDSALLRNGRCFAVVDFKPLLKDEAKVICEDIGVEYNSDIKCLADIFAIKNKFIGNDNGAKTTEKKSFGFMNRN